MNRWHALAAILALITVRGASHRIAALHGELGCGHTHAIERIARENSGEYRDKHPACKAHDNQSRGATGRVSRSRTARDGCERGETGACKTIRTPEDPGGPRPAPTTAKKRVRLRGEEAHSSHAAVHALQNPKDAYAWPVPHLPSVNLSPTANRTT